MPLVFTFCPAKGETEPGPWTCPMVKKGVGVATVKEMVEVRRAQLRVADGEGQRLEPWGGTRANRREVREDVVAGRRVAVAAVVEEQLRESAADGRQDRRRRSARC